MASHVGAHRYEEVVEVPLRGGPLGVYSLDGPARGIKRRGAIEQMGENVRDDLVLKLVPAP